MLPQTIDGMKHVCFFRHALALDERRARFLPEYAYGGSATNPDNKNPSSVKHGSSEWGNNPPTRNGEEPTKATSPSYEDKVRVKHPQTLEVWFPGAHTDM